MLRPIQSAAGGAGARVDRGGRGRRVLPGAAWPAASWPARP